VLREAKARAKKFQQSGSRASRSWPSQHRRKRLPQSGRIRARCGKDVDMRVETAPTAGGESVTIRLLDRSSVLLASPTSASPTIPRHDRGIIKRPHGILLVTADRLRKTTTLYACSRRSTRPSSTSSRRGSVEYQLEGLADAGQLEDRADVRERAALVPRQDPTHHGREIRDRETPSRDHRIADRSPRVLDGPHQRCRRRHHAPHRHGDRAVPRRELARRSARTALVRRPCYECARPVRPSEESCASSASTRARFSAAAITSRRSKASAYPGGTVLEAVGCRRATSSAIGPYRHLRAALDQRRRAPALARKSRRELIRDAGVEAGMVTLRMDGARKVLQGMTTVDEVMLMTTEASD